MLAKLSLLKQPVKYIIIAECLDVITTVMGMCLGLGEGNPLLRELSFLNMLIFKISSTFLVAFVVQKLNFGKWGWIFSAIAILPVFWNLYILTLMTKIMYFGW
jgi:hypothetical protein